MSADVVANEVQFHFFIGNLPDVTFQVVEFSGKEAISFPYEFNISLVSAGKEIDADKVLGQKSTLFIFRTGQYYPYSGIVIEFELRECDTEKSYYRAKMVANLWITSLNFRSRIFQNVTIEEIVRCILNEANINNYKINISVNTRHEYIVQYQETDLNFISRLMESAGIWYYYWEPVVSEEQFESGVSHEQLVITDSPKFNKIAEPSQVIYRPIDGMAQICKQDYIESINAIHYSTCVIPSEIIVKNYNYRCPEVTLTGKQSVSKGNYGTIYEYGGRFKNVEDAVIMAQLLCRRIHTRRYRITGRGNCRGFRAGQCFELQKHHIQKLCMSYVITEVIHTGGVAGNTYRNEFRAIPGDTAANFAPEKSAEMPKVNGVLTAPIESNDSAYASIDDKGRYKIRLPFDLNSKQGDCNGSKNIRLAQPYCGPQYGIHFPSHQGTEMVLACIDGDPDKPIGIGTVPNSNTISPVVAANKQENIIKTAGGNIILMDDTEEKQKIRLQSKGLNSLELNDETERVVISSADINQLVLDDKNCEVVIQCKKNTLAMSYAGDKNFVKVTSADGHMISIDDQNKKISVITNGGNKIELDDEGKKIIIEDGVGKNSVTLDENDGLVFNSSGKITLNARKEIILSGSEIKLDATQGNLDIKAAADVVMTGMNIEQKGAAGIKIEAIKVEAKGSASTSLQGAMMEMRADAVVKIKGDAMVEVNGGGMTKVQGGIVMIN